MIVIDFIEKLVSDKIGSVAFDCERIVEKTTSSKALIAKKRTITGVLFPLIIVKEKVSAVIAKNTQAKTILLLWEVMLCKSNEKK